MKKLYTLLKDADPDEIYHIGAKDGSGFFYIGTVSGFDESGFNTGFVEQIRKDIDRNRGILMNADTYVIPKSVLFGIRTSPDKPLDYCKECERLCTAYVETGKTILEHANRIRNANRKLKDAERRMANFIPLYERDVVDTYPRLQGDGIVIIIAGDEMGKFWNKGEYDLNKGDEDDG